MREKHESMPGKGNNQVIREVNRSIILDLVRRSGRVSRTELAHQSNLTKPTVSTIIDEFIDDGIVREVGLGETLAGGGRPARLLEFNDASAAYLGIHFGVRATRVAVADARGVLRVMRELPSLHNAVTKVGKVVRALVGEALQEAKVPWSRVAAAGVTVPGLVDHETGVCVLAPNLAWQNVSLRKTLQDELRMQVVVNNITQASAVAEGTVGVARGVRSYVWLYVGSGVGAGIVVDGRLFHGQSGFSGEIGHCPVSDDGPLCACGRRGCLETVASTMALIRAAENAVNERQITRLALADSPMTVAAIAAAAAKGDGVANQILAEGSEHLGRGISYLLNILNPEMIVLGGPVIEAGEPFFRSVRASVERHALLPHGVAIVPSMLADRAELTGSVLLAMEKTIHSYRIVGGPEGPARTGTET